MLWLSETALEKSPRLALKRQWAELSTAQCDLLHPLSFPGGSDKKEFACSAGDLGWEDLLEKDMATHSSVFAWRIPMDRGAWWATVHGVAKKLDTTDQVSTAAPHKES